MRSIFAHYVFNVSKIPSGRPLAMVPKEIKTEKNKVDHINFYGRHIIKKVKIKLDTLGLLVYNNINKI